MFICFPDMNSPVIPSLDDIYCTIVSLSQYPETWMRLHRAFVIWSGFGMTLQGEPMSNAMCFK